MTIATRNISERDRTNNQFHVTICRRRRGLGGVRLNGFPDRHRCRCRHSSSIGFPDRDSFPAGSIHLAVVDPGAERGRREDDDQEKSRRLFFVLVPSSCSIAFLAGQTEDDEDHEHDQEKSRTRTSKDEHD
jgi:hypothetical protein